MNLLDSFMQLPQRNTEKMLFPYYRMRKGETSQPIKRKLHPFGTPSRPEWGLQKTPKLALSWITSIFLPSIWIA
jgi:hypothetical protein